MDLLKYVSGEKLITTLGAKIGFLFKNRIVNVATSGIGVGFTGANCGKSAIKGIISSNSLCKTLYFTSATLNGVSCIASSLCLLSGHSCIGSIPLLTASLAYGTSVGAQTCNELADCMDRK